MLGYSVGTPSAPTLPTFTRPLNTRPLSATMGVLANRGLRVGYASTLEAASSGFALDNIKSE